MPWSSLLSPLTNVIGSFVQSKLDKQKAKSEIILAKAKAEAKVYETEATSQMLNERALTESMGDSIKDELWTIWFICVLTACFLPFSQEYVKEGFIFLDEHTPTWFHNLLYIVIGSSFGYRFGKQGLQLLNRKK